MLYAKCALIESKVHFLQITSLFTFCTTRSRDALYFSAREWIFLTEEGGRGGVIKVTLLRHTLESLILPFELVLLECRIAGYTAAE